MNRLRQRFGALHPETIAAALNYAVDLREADDLDQSRTLAQQAYQEYEETLGPEHPYTLYARTNLGIVLRLLDETDEAYTHDSTTFARLTRRLGADGISLFSYDNLTPQANSNPRYLQQVAQGAFDR